MARSKPGKAIVMTITQRRDSARRYRAAKSNYAPPPPESDCPPRTDYCQRCHTLMDPAQVLMDHQHDTGEFLAWVCPSCNQQITDRIGDFGERPPRRAYRPTPRVKAEIEAYRQAKQNTPAEAGVSGSLRSAPSDEQRAAGDAASIEERDSSQEAQNGR
jgi:hypothetical protein